MRIRVRAPSNIALIKYMGKTDAARNLPENASISMTLNRLSTYLEIETIPSTRGGSFSLKGFPSGGIELPEGVQVFPVEFSPKAVEKFQKHFLRVRKRMSEYPELGKIGSEKIEDILVRSVNTFPAGSGIASSASSFAALTLAAFLVHSENPKSAWDRLQGSEGVLIRRKLALISREGSGSSCRSFEGPFVQWQGEFAQGYPTWMPDLAHFVVVISAGEKKVSSTDAHLQVKTSPLWQGRVQRATARFEEIRQAMTRGDIAKVSKLTWDEMWEMHSLFHTGDDPFTYWQPGTLSGIDYFREQIKASGSLLPPIVTLDAGPNIHVLVPEVQRELWRGRLTNQFGAEHLLEDSQGSGAEVLACSTA